MQEAYEVLIDKLKEEIETVHKKTDMVARKDQKIIRMLVEAILQKMPKTAALQIGKEIDEEIGEGGDIEWYMMSILEEVDE
jgi:hypothetical protein